MTIDRYTRVLLTIIAGALVYLCIVLTPMTALEAQTAKRPGEPTGPAEVVIVGARLLPNQRIPVQISESVPLQITGDVKVTGIVQTEERRDSTVRVAVVGWEENADPRRLGIFRPVRMTGVETGSGLPVTQIQRR